MESTGRDRPLQLRIEVTIYVSNYRETIDNYCKNSRPDMTETYECMIAQKTLIMVCPALN